MLRPFLKGYEYLFAFYAFEFWKSTGKDKFWWGEFQERRAFAMGMPFGYRKFRS